MEQTTSVLAGSLRNRVLLGTAIGLAVISFFVFGVDHPDPEWGEYWRIRPLIVTPLAGASAGVLYHLMSYVRRQGGWLTIVGWLVSILGYMIALWLGIVLGLHGTMWN